MARRIQAPAIEFNEFDRSQYASKTDYALPNAPVTLINGFADIGEDYTLQWINTKGAFHQHYGYPKNEAEKYFYNGVMEIIDRGGYAIAAKLPYMNDSKDKLTYASYTLDPKPKAIDSTFHVIDDVIISKMIDRTLYEFLFFPDIDVKAFRFLMKEEYVHVQLSDGIEVSSQSMIMRDESLQFSDYSPQDAVISTSIDPGEEYVNENVVSLLNLGDIHPPIIADIVKYVDDVCEFKYEAKRVFNELFYEESSTNCYNNSTLLIKSIYEGAELSDLSAYNPKCVKYEKQISSMLETFKNVEEVHDISSLYQSFSKQHSLDYFKQQYNDILAQIVANYGKATEEQKHALDVLRAIMQSFAPIERLDAEYTEVRMLDDSLCSYCEIYNTDLSDSCKMSFEDYDDMRTGVLKPEANQFYIVDITRGKYEYVDVLSNYNQLNQRQVIDVEVGGIVPVVTTPMNALMFQELLSRNGTTQMSSYNCVADMHTSYTPRSSIRVVGRDIFIEPQNYTTELSSDNFDDETLSKIASQLFPTITTKHNGYLDREHMKEIGIVVLKSYKDVANNGRISFKVLESWHGSLDYHGEDELTHANTYIGNQINDNSNYINYFQNIKINDKECGFDTYLIKNQFMTSLGFYAKECEKDISVPESINKALDLILKHAHNPYSLPLDLIVDAGVSNIAQFIRDVHWKDNVGKYDFDDADNLNATKNVTSSSVSAWRAVLEKFDNFCKNTRKDCMFIADGLRKFCLIGNQKKVRRFAIQTTFMRDIYPGLKHMNVLDSSYSAGYCNWLWQQDRYTNDFMWMPPSIKAAGVYVYTDTYFRPWDAPAGENRGVIPNVFDVAFNPTVYEAGKLYTQQWNYAVSYPIKGIVLEGQKTFQKDMSALDRVNVRRLLLYLEKQVIRIGRQYLYEQNTEYLRQRFVDDLTVVFDDCVARDGIVEYAMKCDEENNTMETIENHELHIKIAIKPVKTIEFIIVDFIITNQSANVNEEVMK